MACVSAVAVGRSVAALAALAWAGTASASDPCADVVAGRADQGTAARIAAVACEENRLWFSPFIDSTGRLAHTRVAEAEGALLADGATPTWHRVAGYWRASGLLSRMDRFEGAAACAGPLDTLPDRSACRAFLVDTPWSAVFVSYVLERAGVAGLRPSVRHIDFLRDAYPDAGQGPYVLMDPLATTPAPGDLLCFSRMGSAALGHAGFVAWLARSPAGGMEMHCDIVVATDNGRAFTIGGNVLQGVTMRVLPLNRRGRLWGVQQQSGVTPACSPGNAAACSFNRQDWVALLRLRTPGAASPCCAACTASSATPATGTATASSPSVAGHAQPPACKGAPE